MRLFVRSVTTHSRLRGSLALIASALVLAIPASASAAGFTARLSAPNHSPRANKRWWITVTVAKGRTKLSGKARFEFFFQGQRVNTQPWRSFTHGVYHDFLLFPGEAIGEPLTLRIVVKTKYGTDNINWAVKARG